MVAAADTAAQRRIRLVWGSRPWADLYVSAAVYWVEDSWAVNGRIGSYYTFLMSMDRLGRIRSVSVQPRSRE